MRKLFNIRLKDEPEARIRAIRVIKEEFGYGLMEAKIILDRVLSKGEIVCLPDGVYEIFHNESSYLEERIKRIFDCEFITDEKDKYSSNVSIDIPSNEMVIALAWYYGLSLEDRGKVDLIAKWTNRACIAVC